MRGGARGRTSARPTFRLIAASAFAAAATIAVGPISPAAGSTPDARAAIAKAPLPRILTEVESSAEDIVDFALSGDRNAVVTEAAVLKAAARGPAAAALTRSGVRPGSVALLKRRATRVADLSRRGSFTSIALAANAVSGLMPDLYGRFRNSVPPLIFRLDYLEREAQLRSRARQPDRVASAVRALGLTWPRVRARVVAADGVTEAAAYDRHVATFRGLEAGDRERVQAEALRGLELVDLLERAFAR